jgi:hypothetical protein
MPKEISHWTFAEKVYQRLPEQSELKTIIKEHHHFYLIGAIAPDFPSAILFGPSKNKFRQLMTKLHDTKDSSFDPILNALSSYQGSIPGYALSFFSGVIAHMNADMTFHPLVFYYSGNDTSKKDTETRHSILETTLDLHLLKNVHLENQESLAYSIHHKSVPQKQLLEVLSLFYGLDNNKDQSQLKRLLLYYTFLQWGFKRRWIYLMIRNFERFTGIYQKHNYTYFYPKFEKVISDFWGGPITYQHPITGKLITTNLDKLEQIFLNKTVGDFKTINLMIQQENNDYQSLFSNQPNLLTGMKGALLKDMAHFNIDNPLQGVLDY